MRAHSTLNLPRACVLLMIAGAALTGCARPREGPAAADFTLPPPAPVLPSPFTPLAKPVIADPAKVALGKRLFNDVRLSLGDSRACSSCHDLGSGGDDGRRVSTGVEGREGVVNTPTVFNSGLNFAQFWDGRARTLEEQIDATVRNPTEMEGDWQRIEQTLRADPAIAASFADIYEDAVTARNVVDALASYVRALVTWDTPFDRYLKGDTTAIGDDARAGFGLFTTFGCVSCHQGRNLGGNLFQRFGVMGDYFADRGRTTDVDLGRYNVTGREEDRYTFKVPSLRNVADTEPYFHDGSVETLEQAVEIMIEYQLGRPADDEQVRLLIAFLQTLSGQVEETLL